ncbi:hypothetical protein [Streptomyces phytohabitans]|uniref:hypothetical protein n=1 Tax=Streptomyces phytohabitans TaxID=1150371 RepID=UPI00345C4AC0
MSGLLFLALAFFAYAQAATVRNGGQSAADAAALAAARDDRDQLFDGFLDSLDDKDAWQDWLDLTAPLGGDGCGPAGDYAGKNDADVASCDPVTRDGDPGYTVEVETRFDTGDTIVPGTENRTAKATATAVVRPLCDFDVDITDIEITCDGEEFEIDPDDVLDLDPADLFSVVLAD